MNNLNERVEHIEDIGSGRNDIDRDYAAILYSHAFRRLKHKTQVFFYTQNDHICTRLDHSLYVAAIAEVICKNFAANGMNCDSSLAKTIGIGHDLGHAPFGHAGESVLNDLAQEIGGFNHEKHGLRIVDKIEKPRTESPIIGLNLTLAVRDGIVNHNGEDQSTSITPAVTANLSGNSIPCTIEGCVVRLVDKIAYLGRDLEDAVITGLIDESDIPAEIGAIIGTKNGEVVDYFVGDLIESSSDKVIALSGEASHLMVKLGKFNELRVYKHDKLESYKIRVKDVLETLYERFLSAIKEYEDQIDLYLKDDLNVVKVFGKFIGDRKVLYYGEEKSTFDDINNFYRRIVIDFLSTLTDNFVFQACSEYFLPRPL